MFLRHLAYVHWTDFTRSYNCHCRLERARFVKNRNRESSIHFSTLPMNRIDSRIVGSYLRHSMGK